MSLEQLDAWLHTLEPAPRVDGVSMLDGYLTAIVIGPCSIPPDEWFVHLVGERGRIASASGTTMAALTAITTRFNAISQGVSLAPSKHAPLFEKTSDGLSPPGLQKTPVQVIAPSHIGDPCPRRECLHQDLGFLVYRPPPPPPPPHRAGDHLDPTIRLTLMPALITALMAAAIHCTARPVASASMSEITGRCRKVVHSHRLPCSGHGGMGAWK